MLQQDTETKELRNDDESEANNDSLKTGRRVSFGKLRRELTDDELKSSGVQKLLLDELDRMEGESATMKSLSIKYNNNREALAVAEAKLKTSNAFEIISTATVASGSMLFGAAFSLESGGHPNTIMIVMGVVLVVVGVSAKFMRS